MKIQVLSDLHLEFGHPFEVLPTGADAVVLAGDIHLGTAGVTWAQRAFPNQPVVYVAGNHEFYKNHWIKLLDKLRAAAQGSNVHVLENDELIVDRVRFLGCSLWTDFELFGEERRHWTMIEAEKKMGDYRKIRGPRVRSGYQDDYSKLKPIQTVQRFRRSRSFLEQSLRTSFDGPTVIVTHHLPSRDSVPSRFAESLTSAAYASDLTALMDGCGPDLWIHGHAHGSSDYMVASTRVVCNPRGYWLPEKKFENAKFDPNLVVRV
jgi:predicted phosphodiesterase